MICMVATDYVNTIFTHQKAKDRFIRSNSEVSLVLKRLG